MFLHLEVDYRRYVRIGQWSVLGLRGAALSSRGRDRLTYYLGGPAWFLPFYAGYDLNLWPLRGCDFGALSGSHAVLANVELRVPLVRRISLGWPASVTLGAIDASVFTDIGGAWDRLGDITPWPLGRSDADPEETPRLSAAVGMGFMLNFIVPLNIEIARRTDFRELSGYRSHVSLGRSF